MSQSRKQLKSKEKQENGSHGISKSLDTAPSAGALATGSWVRPQGGVWKGPPAGKDRGPGLPPGASAGCQHRVVGTWHLTRISSRLLACLTRGVRVCQPEAALGEAEAQRGMRRAGGEVSQHVGGTEPGGGAGWPVPQLLLRDKCVSG